MKTALNPERAVRLAIDLDRTTEASNEGAPRTESLGPVQRLAPDSEQLANRDVSMLLALALAESTRELAKMHRDNVRILTEGRIALLVGMIRLEPQVAAFLEDTRFLVTMASSAANLASSAAPAAKGGVKKIAKKVAPKETPKAFDLKGVVAKVAARPGVAKRLGRFQRIQDHLVLTNPRARYVFARQAAVAELGGRFDTRPELRDAFLEVKTKQHARLLVSEARGRRPTLDLNDWHLVRPGSDARRADRTRALIASGVEPAKAKLQADREQMARDVFGDAPTKRELQLLDEAAQLLATGGEPFHAGLVRRTKLLSREEIASKFERHRPFYGRESDAAIRTRIAEAIRERRVDLSLPLKDADGFAKAPDRIGVGKVIGTVTKELADKWNDGWAKDEQDLPEGLHGVTEAERHILDAWFAELMQSRLEVIRWAGRFGDLLTDVADITLGIDD